MSEPVQHIFGPDQKIVAQLSALVDRYRTGDVACLCVVSVAKDGQNETLYLDAQGGIQELARLRLYLGMIDGRVLRLAEEQSGKHRPPGS